MDLKEMMQSLPPSMRPFLNEIVTKVQLTPLCSLIHEKKLRDVEFFIRQGHDVNEKHEDGRTALHFAVELGYTSMVALLLHHGADVNVADMNGLTALHIACFYLHKDIVQLLLDAKADIHAHSSEMGSPIHAATIWGHPTKITDPCDVVSLLIEHGANVNHKINDSDGLCPLATAVHDNNVNLLSILIAANVDVNVSASTFSAGKKPLLSIAVRKGYIEIVKAFLKVKSLYVTVCDKNLNTALHEASMAGNLQMVKILVKKNFDLNRLNIDHETPLHLALATHNFAVAKYLVHLEGIDVNLPSIEFEDLPLHFAIIQFANASSLENLVMKKEFSILKENVIQTIIDKMQYLNAGSSKKITPLEMAVYSRDISTCKYLIKKGANVNASDFQNRMNLMKSIIYNEDRKELARLYPPLKLACAQNDNIEMVRLLLYNGAEVNDGPKLFRALTIAIETGDFETVKELQYFGAQIDKETLNESKSQARTCTSDTGERNKIINLLKLNLKLMKNVRMNNIEEVKKNIEDGACINVSHARTGASSLIYASWKGHENIVDLLLDNGANVNFKGAKGLTSLHMACRCNVNSNITRKLLLHGAFYNEKDLNQGTPLVYARNNDDAFKLLSTIHFLFENVRMKKLNDVIEVLYKMKNNEADNFNVIKCVKNKAGQTLNHMVRDLYGRNMDYTDIIEKLHHVLNTNPE